MNEWGQHKQKPLSFPPQEPGAASPKFLLIRVCLSVMRRTHASSRKRPQIVLINPELTRPTPPKSPQRSALPAARGRLPRLLCLVPLYRRQVGGRFCSQDGASSSLEFEKINKPQPLTRCDPITPEYKTKMSPRRNRGIWGILLQCPQRSLPDCLSQRHHSV